jgi:hypothetical protein
MGGTDPSVPRLVGMAGAAALAAGGVLLLLLNAAYTAGWENMNNYAAAGRAPRMAAFWAGIRRFWEPILGGTILLWLPGAAIRLVGGFFVAWAAAGRHFRELLSSLSNVRDLAYNISVAWQDFDLAAYYRVLGAVAVWLLVLALYSLTFSFWRQAVVAGELPLFRAVGVAVGFVIRHLPTAAGVLAPWVIVSLLVGGGAFLLRQAAPSGTVLLMVWGLKLLALSLVTAYFRLALFVFYREGVQAERAAEEAAAEPAGGEAPQPAEA